MDFQQKAQAMNALSKIQICMDVNGEWYISWPGVEIKDGPVLKSVAERAESPAMALNKAWDKIVALPTTQYLVLDAYQIQRRAVRWNGFMWADIPQ